MSYGKIISSNIENIESSFSPKAFIIRSIPNHKKKNDLKKKIQQKRKENVENLW